MLTISVDTKPVEDALSATARGIPSIQRQTVGIVAKGYVREIKRQITASGIKRRTGWLSKAYAYRVRGDTATVYPRAKGTGGARNLAVAKTSTLNYGADISVRPGRKFLQISGAYHARPKRVTVRGRSFLQSAEASYIGGRRYELEVEKMIENQLKKYWG